ncbi:MAG: O-antigen ligase family protein [Acidobacteria bacterium]|nr:O-antigen ligase family protein [Acidobacteriota bacterium]
MATAAFIGVALLALVAPFETTEPLVRLPQQSISNLEAAVVLAMAVWGLALVRFRQLPAWRTPLTLPWATLMGALILASAAAPAFRMNAFHMAGRLTAAFAIFLLTVTGLTTRARVHIALGLVVASGLIVSTLVILEYAQVRPVLDGLKAFRPGITVVGSQLRAGGSLQYPTIASMYLEVVFALGAGLLLSEVDAGRSGRAALWFVAVLVVAEAITLTFTRAGLIAMAAVLGLLGALRYRHRGTDVGVGLVAALGVMVAVLFAGSRSAEWMWLRFTSGGQESWYRAKVEAPTDLAMATGATSLVPIEITNTGRIAWDPQGEPPFYLSYHWMPAEGDRFVAFDGARTPFPAPVEPGSTIAMQAEVRAPRQPGQYRLSWDVVLEHQLWFSTEPGAMPMLSRATVSGDALETIARTTPPPKPTVRPGRLQLWTAAARMIAAHPLLGVGPDNFRLSYGEYAGLTPADPRIHSNNMYLEVLTGSGVVGGLAFAWLLWRSAGVLLPNWSAPSGAAAMGVAAALLAAALHGCVDSFLSFGPTYVLFALTLGFAVACARGPSPLEMMPEADAHRV